MSHDYPHMEKENDDSNRGNDVANDVERTLMMVASGVVSSRNAMMADVSIMASLLNLFSVYQFVCFTK